MWQVRWCHEIQTYFLSSDTSILVPNLMCFKGPLLLRATLKRHRQRKIKIGVYLSIIHLVAVHLKTPASMESSKNVRMLHKFIIQLNRLYPILEQNNLPNLRSMNMQCKGQYLSADAGSVSEGSFSAFFSFSSWKQTGITLRTAACHISIFSLYHRIPSDVLKLDFLALHGGDWLSVAIKCLFCAFHCHLSNCDTNYCSWIVWNPKYIESQM